MRRRAHGLRDPQLGMAPDVGAWRRRADVAYDPRYGVGLDHHVARVM
jgi:hypothetical protein